VYRRLNSELYLDLNNKLFAELHRDKFEKSFQQLFLKLFASFFGSLFELMFKWLLAFSCLALRRQVLLPRRPVGRPLHGRIVVPAPGRYHTLWCRHRPVRLRPHDKDSYQARRLASSCKF